MRHRLGTLLLVVGLGLLAWAATVYLWKDPFTTAYTAYEQRRLEASLDRRFDSWQPRTRPAGPAKPATPAKTEPTTATRLPDVRREARRYRLASEEGDAIVRMKIPRLHLDVVVVNGTSAADLRRGPGRHLETFMPGERELVYIAGHRTTYGAPFGNINELKAGDKVFLDLPYASFEYVVTRHRIVDDNDLSVLESPNHEQLVLQACHPRFLATERYLVYARPLSVTER